MKIESIGQNLAVKKEGRKSQYYFGFMNFSLVPNYSSTIKTIQSIYGG